jgi:hypothetical protein
VSQGLIPGVGFLSLPDKWRDEDDDMRRELCPVCKRPQALRDDGRMDQHRRRVDGPLRRDMFGTTGAPCEGAGMLPHKPRVA